MKVLGFLKFYLSPRTVYRFYLMTVNGYLVESGWMASALEKRPVDKDRNPTPWFTTSCIAFLQPRLRGEFRVLEFGAGNSTLFFAKHVAYVHSIEDNPEWYQRLQSQIGQDNVRLELLEGEAYVRAAESATEPFQIIVIDGSRRLECTRNALPHLAHDGVVILDNSLRPEYEPIYQLLHENGFRHIDFWGMAGGSRKHNCTTLFYRDGNCLGV
jgi:hypothetical protein